MNVLVLGCGRVGAGVVGELASRGMRVHVVDHDDRALARLPTGVSARRWCGSILDEDVLLDAGIDHADAVAVLTGRDDLNTVIALTARLRRHVPTVVTRSNDVMAAEFQQRLGIRTLAPVAWGVHRIADLLVTTSTNPIATLGTGGSRWSRSRSRRCSTDARSASSRSPGRSGSSRSPTRAGPR